MNSSGIGKAEKQQTTGLETEAVETSIAIDINSVDREPKTVTWLHVQTADPTFHENLRENFECEARVQLPHWPYCADSLSVWKRKKKKSCVRQLIH